MTPLDNFKPKVSIKDENGDDASGLFFVVVTQKTGIASVEGSSVSDPVDITWQLIPNSNAGGTSANGKKYSISATINYNFSGGSYTYTTAAETITVKPMPKLTIDYKLPYITMTGKPVKIKAIVTNNGYGPAHNLVIKSAQPKIIENLNNIPVSFTLSGSSATPNDSTLQNGVLDISFGDIPAGGTAEGYWLLSTSKDGYFVEFTSTLTHQDYMGIQLDPLIEATNTHLIPAIGGEIFMPPNTTEGMKVELYQGGALIGQDTVNGYGNYLIPDLTSGVYQWRIKDASGNSVAGSDRDITVVDGQPTARIDYGKPEQFQMPVSVPNVTNAKKLILVTHGWNGSTLKADGTDDWPNQMVADICQKLNIPLTTNGLCKNETILVRSYNWSKGAATGGVIDGCNAPKDALAHAIIYADSLANEILAEESVTGGYTKYHFIAHSAGSNLIQHLVERLTTDTKIGIKPQFQTTFLDPYDPTSLSRYGDGSDWSENYVDMRSLSPTCDYTKLRLKNAYNFKVDPIDPDQTTLLDPDPVHRHAWPYMLYENTITMSNSIGFPLAFESTPNLWNNNYDYVGPVVNGRIFYKNGQCTPSSVSDFGQCGCTIDDYANIRCPDQQEWRVNKAYDGLNLAMAKDESKTGSKSNVDGVVSLRTSSPAWISFQFNTTETKNLMAFDYEFKSESDGVLSIFLEDKLIYSSDERFTAFGKNNIKDISIGDIEPGDHIITFRLDKFGAVQSEIEISNIRLGLVTTSQIGPPLDSVKPTSSITSPISGAAIISTNIQFLGSADDGVGSGVKTVEVSLDGGNTWILANGATSWQYLWNVPASGTYTVLSRATDNAGNTEVPSTGVTFTVSLPDLVAPTGSISIHAADNYTKTTAITLDLAANDPSGVTQMCISNTETCTDWQTFVQSLPWQLTTGDGLKTVRAWFRDGAGNSNTQPYSASVTLDMTAPTVAINPVTTPTNILTQTVTGKMEEGATVTVTCPSATVGLVSYPSSTSWSVAVSGLKLGNNSLTATAKDAAGNTTVVTTTIIMTATAKPGDCDASGTVTIDEVQAAINMYLGLKTVAACVDTSGEGKVSIDEVQKVINGYLGL